MGCQADICGFPFGLFEYPNSVARNRNTLMPFHPHRTSLGVWKISKRDREGKSFNTCVIPENLSMSVNNLRGLPVSSGQRPQPWRKIVFSIVPTMDMGCLDQTLATGARLATCLFGHASLNHQANLLKPAKCGAFLKRITRKPSLQTCRGLGSLCFPPTRQKRQLFAGVLIPA